MENQKFKNDVSMTVTEPVLQTATGKKVTRRSVIKKAAVGTAALAGCSALPEKWVTKENISPADLTAATTPIFLPWRFTPPSAPIPKASPFTTKGSLQVVYNYLRKIRIR